MLIPRMSESLIGGRWSWLPRLFRALFSSDHLLLVVGSALLIRVAAAIVDALIDLPNGAAGIASATVLALMMVGLPVFGAPGEAREVSLITAAAGRDAGTGYPSLPSRARRVVGLAATAITVGLIGPAVLLDGVTVDDASAIVVGALFFAFQLRMIAGQIGRWTGRA